MMKETIQIIFCLIYNLLLILITCYMCVKFSYWWLFLLLFLLSIRIKSNKEEKEND